MPGPSAYDPTSPEEQPVPPPSAPLQTLSPTEVLQPPLTRRGTGPGIIIFLPQPGSLNPRSTGPKPLDPPPVQKWAEEGFAVVGVTPQISPDWSAEESLKRAIAALLASKELDLRDKFGVIVYCPKLLQSIASALHTDSRLVCLITYGPPLDGTQPAVPVLIHTPSASGPPTTRSLGLITTHTYMIPSESPYFVLPQVSEYITTSAAVAHTRSLVFLRKHLGGPFFDLEGIWEEHTLYEFVEKSLAKTMSTMVAEPYVNHVPTMTGGIGRENLTAFYRDHFIFTNPPDSVLELISRTVGPDRIVDEFIFKCTHDRPFDIILPGIPPSGKKLVIPMIAVVNIRGDRLYNEHIWWDQATALRQAGVLPVYIPYETSDGSQKRLKLPVAGVECAEMLLDELNGKSNEMFGKDWGVVE